MESDRRPRCQRGQCRTVRAMRIAPAPPSLLKILRCPMATAMPDCFVAPRQLSCDVTLRQRRPPMWDYAPPRKPFYQRPAFAIPFWTCLVVVTIVAVAGYAEK